MQKFYFAGTMTIAIRTIENGTDVLNWVLGDHLGSTSATANADGSLNSVIQYTAYGEVRLTQGMTPTKYRYTGQLTQAELGLDYYFARWYDPYLNHWVQPDTIIPNVINPIDYDRYAYARNNPIRYTDNSGHCVDGLTTVACLIIIGVVILKVVDYGWTAYDAYQSTQVLTNPNSTQEERDAAAQNLAMTAAFEAAEPDDLTPFALPLDDIARTGILSVGKQTSKEAVEQTVKDVGQNHHVFSKKIMDVLADHKTLKGIFKKDDYIIQAADKASHNGYQSWHRDYDDEIVKWLKDNEHVSKDEFLEFIDKVYKRDDMKKRFPNAERRLKKLKEAD